MKLFVIIGTIIILSATMPVCSSSSDNSSINLIVRKITFIEISFDSNMVDVIFQIENDNEIIAHLNKLEYKIYVGHNDNWIMIGQGEEESVDIYASNWAGFTVSTTIPKKRLSESVTTKILGTKPVKAKVDGIAWFTVGSESYPIEFSQIDIDPYSLLTMTDDTEVDLFKGGTEGVENE